MPLKSRKTVSLMILIIFTLLSGFSAYCDDDRSYYMSSFRIAAQLDASGDMKVEEQITYKFDGSFRGVYRTLMQEGSAGITDFNVSKLVDGKLTEFMNNNSEADNTYQLLDEGNGIRLKMFSASEDESKTFVIKYKVNALATRYSDIGELYWKFMGEDTEVKIENFDVRITLPEGADKEQLRIFAHGPLSGVSEIIDSNTVELRIDKLQPRNFVEARVLFPAKLISTANKTVDQAALQRILAEEKGFAEEANAKREKARAVLGFSLLFALFQLLMIIYLYIKYDREYKTQFSGEYFRELPGSYSPAVMSVLWNFGNVKPRDITATIMDLVRRKYLELKVEQTEIKGIIKHKLEHEYTFVLNKDSDTEALSKHEKYLVDWLIYTIGNGDSVSLDEIEQSSKTMSGAESFKGDYDVWTEYVREEADKLSFFDKNALKGKIFGVTIAVVGMIYAGITASFQNNIAGMAALMLASMTLLAYSLLIKRRSRYGVEQFKMWKAFKRFLQHFSQLDKAELPAVTLWEHYLVYAITLGVAKDVISQLKLVFRDEDFRNTRLTYMYMGHYGNYNYFNAIDNVTTTMIKTTESVYTQAVSKLSSSSGGGGGFSGGGGGGGGGGGAGAF